MGGAGRVRYRHLKRTVIAVLATVALVLIFGLAARAVLEAGPTRRAAIRWVERLADGYGAEVEIGDFHWSMLPPGVRLEDVRLRTPGISADIDVLEADLARVRLTRRTVDLGTVAARGVRLSMEGLPQSAESGGRGIKVRIRHLELTDVYFDGVDLPGGLSLDLDGLRTGWTGEGETASGYAEIAGATVRLGAMAPIQTSINARFDLTNEGLRIPAFHLDGEGFTLGGSGRFSGAGIALEADGPLDIGWLDGFIKTRGLLDGEAVVQLGLDTGSTELVRAAIQAPRIDVAGFRLDDVRGDLSLAGKSLRGTLDHARFLGGVLRGSYRLAEFGGRFPHTVDAAATGISLPSTPHEAGRRSGGTGFEFRCLGRLGLEWQIVSTRARARGAAVSWRLTGHSGRRALGSRYDGRKNHPF